MNNNNLSSKPFAVALALVVLSLTQIGCSRRSDQSLVDGATTERVAPADKITLYSWGEYFSPALLERFEKETGIEVEYEIYDTSDEMREQIKSSPGEYDVVVMDDLALQRMRRTRVIRELSLDLLPNSEHIDTKYLASGDSFDSGVSSLPYFWGTTLIAYNKRQIPNPEHSWSLLFDSRVKNHVFFVEERMECTENMLRFLGYPPSTEDSDQLGEAADKLLELSLIQNARFGSDADGKEGLDDGSIWAGMIYNGDLAQALLEDTEDKIGYFYPKEGTTTWVDNFTVPKDTPRWKEAHKFINFMMDPIVAAESSTFVQFATANKSAQDHLAQIDPDLLSSVVFSDGEARGSTLTEGSPNRQRLIHDGWIALEKSLVSRDSANQGAADQLTGLDESVSDSE
jgi:spermidine/putrescine-binding protein